MRMGGEAFLPSLGQGLWEWLGQVTPLQSSPGPCSSLTFTLSLALALLTLSLKS